LGNKIADRKAAEAWNSAFLDNSIRGSIAAKKITLIRKEKLWKSSPPALFRARGLEHLPVQMQKGAIPNLHKVWGH
jgi:hypothetical protein